MNKFSLRIVFLGVAVFVAALIIIMAVTGSCSGDSCASGDVVVNAVDPTDAEFKTQSTRNDGGDGGDGSDSGEIVGNDGMPTDVLPDRLINVFGCVGVYQLAPLSELDAETALVYEQNADLIFGEAFFSCSRYLLENCHFSINENGSLADLQSFGIDTASLEGRFGAEAPVCVIEIYSANGEYKTCVFEVGEDAIIAFGEGMHVFEYELIAAVG